MSKELRTLRQMFNSMAAVDRALAEIQAHKEAMAKARSKRRATCQCAAYPWPHRPSGGLCRYPDPPAERWQGMAGKNRPTETRRRGLRKTLCREYGLHPIRDRAKIDKLLPGIYAAAWRDGV